MAYEFRLPDIGEGLIEAEVVEWMAEVGQEVALDQPLVQIETDKAVTEVPSPRAGVLLHRGAPAGQTVKVGQILAVIGKAGETWSPEGGRAEPAEEATAAPQTPEAGPAGATTADPASPSEHPATAEDAPTPATAEEAPPIVGTLPSAEEAPSRAARGEPQALPLIRKLAKELGVALATVKGTGPGGRVTRRDVERAARKQARPPRQAPAAAGGPSEERVRMTKLRRTIAEHLSRSWREIPHVTTFGEAEASRLLQVQRALAQRRGERLPLETMFIRAVLPALQAHPQLNATVDGEDLILKRRYDIGIAVDTPDGLIVPVVKGADLLDLWALAKEVAHLIEAARSRNAKHEELTGGTFTISNIGAVGGGFGTPIIPWGTTAILSFGRVEERPVVRQGHVEPAHLLPLSLSYDHRAIDGAMGRRFLGAVIENLEEPALLFAS